MIILIILCFVTSLNHNAPHYVTLATLCYFLSPRSKYFRQNPVLIHPQSTGEDQVSHSYKSIGKIIRDSPLNEPRQRAAAEARNELSKREQLSHASTWIPSCVGHSVQVNTLCSRVL
jgi:hypothetical protein